MTSDLYDCVHPARSTAETSVNPSTNRSPAVSSLLISKSPESHQPTACQPHRSRHVSATVALDAAKRSVISLQETLRQDLDISQLLGSKDCDWRLAHLQPIFSLQNVRSTARSEAEDRLLLVCSCLSLATDFQHYESALDRTPRHDVALSRILQGQDPAIQQNGKHCQKFLAKLTSYNIHKERFDAGLRLGGKLSLIEAVGGELGLGPGLSLLMGYECSKISRMPYREISQMFILLRDDSVGKFHAIREFCSSFGLWWLALHRNYHSRHSELLSFPATMNAAYSPKSRYWISTKISLGLTGAQCRARVFPGRFHFSRSKPTRYSRCAERASTRNEHDTDICSAK